ncbi:MAG TPA: BTAD domain-containing putative transcriptional regulator [Actinomycetota bacterium]|nr:BTAD domain-containing putative transcriptional regulator [Actinomycetota bacterium]
MAATGLDIRLLGRFSVRRAGKEIPPSEFHGRLARTLFRLLVTRPDQLTTRDYLTESLWPGRAPADPERNLNVMIARIRRALGDASLIATGSGGYSFHPTAGCKVDAELFQERVRLGRGLLKEGRHGAALKEFRAGLDLWAGDPLAEDAYEEWAQEYRGCLAAAHLEALEGASAASLAVGLAGDAVTLARSAAAGEPLREASHLLLARSLAGSGDTAGALATLRSFRIRMADELGLDPPAGVGDLERDLLRGVVVVPGMDSKTMAPAMPSELEFSGRGAELGLIVESLSGSGEGIVLVHGPPGSGKTRLLKEAARRLDRPVLYGRAFSAERDEPWSLIRSLIQEAVALFPDSVSRLPGRVSGALGEAVPGLQADLPPAGEVIDPQSVRALAVQGAVRVLQEVVDRRAVLVVDDLQWCDPTSLAVLSTACRRVEPMPLVLAYRSSEPTEPVLNFMNEVRPRAAASIELGALPGETITGFFANPEIGWVVLEETDGTPLAISELIRSLAAAGVVAPEPGHRWSARSPSAVDSVREAARGGRIRSFEDRAGSLPAPAAGVLKALALLGHPANARLLARATGTVESAVLDHLELMGRATLVRLGDQGWSPSHDLVGEAVAGQMSREERGRLHALLAGALESERADRSEVARHLDGAGDKPAAARAFAEAGRGALDRYASKEAEELAESGLALDPEPALAAELLEVRAEARARTGRIAEAREDLRTALSGVHSGPARSLLLSRLALLISGADDYVHAGELVELALTEAGPDLPARARALAVGTMIEGNLGNLDKANSLAGQALELFRRLDDANGAADVLELQGLNLVYAGQLTEGVALLGRVADLFRDAGKLIRIGPTVTFRALGLRMMLRLEEAIHELDELLELELQLGSAEGECWCRTARGLILADLDRIDESKREGEEALRIARAINHRELLSGSLLNFGYACQVGGDLNEAMRLLTECAEVAAGLPAFLCFAEGGMARIEVSRGNLEAAEAHVQAAVAAGFPFAMYQAELAHAEIMVARGDPEAAGRVASYLASAESGGAWLTAGLLRNLLDRVNPESW